MSAPARSPLPEVEVAAAAGVRRLAAALLGRTVTPEISGEVAVRLAELAELVETCPTRTKQEAFATYPGHQRIEHFLETGRWPDGPPDGGEVTFDALSFVGGPLNPFSAGTRFWRDGDDAVAIVTFPPSYEGPPSRVHGGMIAATFDEVMGAVFRVRAMASSFTGTLAVRYTGPAPMGTELEFRATLSETKGRKHTVTATATGPDGPFATAEGIFIQMSDEQFAAAVDDGPSTTG